MFRNLALFPVPTAQKREGQKGQRVLSRTQPPRSAGSETAFMVQTLAKYSNVKSLSWNLIGKVFTKVTKRRALLKSIFVIPIRWDSVKNENIFCHEDFMEKGHFDLAEIAVVMTYTANIWTLISSLYFVFVVWSAGSYKTSQELQMLPRSLSVCQSTIKNASKGLTIVFTSV